MSNVFKFQKREGLSLKFEQLDGSIVEFRLDVADPLFLSKVETFSETLIDIEKNYANVGKIKNMKELKKEVEEVMDICSDGIDQLLGDGATRQIFGNQPINFVDLSELSAYIISEVANFSKSDALKQYSPQRLGK